MGENPHGTVIDRIDNSKGYEPENCRWADYKLSTENRRNTIWLEFDGRRIRVNDFAASLKIPEFRVRGRLASGWTPTQIANRPGSINGYDRSGGPARKPGHRAAVEVKE
jgi:hypothetical protein